MPNIVTPIRDLIKAKYPSAVVAQRGYDYITHDVDGAFCVFVAQGGGLHYLDDIVWHEQNTDFEDSGEPQYDDANLTAQSLLHVGSKTERKVYPRRDQPNEYFILGRPEYWTGSRWRNLNLPGRVRSGHQLSWDSADIAFSIQHTGHGIKYDVTLKNSSIAMNIRWSIELVGLTWDNWTLISQSSGKIVTVFPIPTMLDAELTQRQVAGTYADGYITYTPDYTDLVYPIQIDPTFTDGYGGDASTYIDTCVDYEQVDTNYGGEQWIKLIQSGGVSYYQGLIRFDLSSIPDSATIDSATLYFYQHAWGGGAYTADVHRILSANSGWTEAGATYNHYDGTNDWAGGHGSGCKVSGTDFNATVVGTVSGNGSDPDGTEIEVTLDTDEVKAMLTADYGFVLITVTGSGTQWLVSSDHATTGWRPKLVVVYTAGATHNLSAVCVSASITPDDTAIAVTREFSAIQMAASTMPDTVSLAIARELGAIAVSQSATPDDVVLDIGLIYEFAATLLAQSAATDTAVLIALRELAAIVLSQSMTPDTAALAIARELAAITLSQSATSDISALAILRELATTALSQSTTPDDAILGMALPLTAILASASATPDDAALAILRELAALALSQSVTPDMAALAVLRELMAVLVAQSVTPDDAILSIAGIYELAATLLAQSATPDTSILAVTRELLAVSLAQSVTPDDAVLGLIWQLAAAISAQSITPDDAVLAIVRQLATTALSQSTTPDDVMLAVLQELAAMILGQSATPDDATLTVAAVIIELAAVLLAQSLTSSAALSVSFLPIPSRIFSVPFEDRTDSVEGEDRTLIVPLEIRTDEI